MQKACYLHLEKKKPQNAINNVNWKSENTSPGNKKTRLKNKKNLIIMLYKINTK